MKPTLLASCIGVFIVVLAACTPQPKKAQYTVDQYLANRELMNKKVEECASNPGELRDDPDCINAGTAASRDSWGSLRDLPPIFDQTAPANKQETPGNK
jgi:hypothetical protein